MERLFACEFLRAFHVGWDAISVQLHAAEPLRLDNIYHERRDVYPNPLPVQFVRGDDSGAAPTKRIQHNIPFIGTSLDDAF